MSSDVEMQDLLARLQDRAAKAEADLELLRGRLRNIYHMSINYGNQPVLALQAIRKASMPGA